MAIVKYKKIIYNPVVNMRAATKIILNQSGIGQDTPPYPYVISLWKLFLLSIVTFGLFEVYWFYKQWKSFSIVTNNKHGKFVLILLAMVSGFSSLVLFKRIENVVQEVDPTFILKPYGLAAVYIIINLLYRLPDPYWLISLFSVIALLPVQHAVNYYWKDKYKEKLIESEFGKGNIVALIFGCIFLLLVLAGMLNTSNT